MTGPSRTDQLIGIEAGRGIAATVVVLYHSARHLNKVYGVPNLMSVFQFGHAGVDLFFVISGFIILFVHYRDIGQPGRLRHYLGRRFSRIMPTYWVALALTIVLSLGGGHGFPSFLAIARSVTLIPSPYGPLLGIAWTLQYEIVFYMLFSLLIINRALGCFIIILWVIAIIILQSGFCVDHRIPQSLYGIYNLEFLLGMAAAYWLRNHTVLAPRLILAGGTLLFIAGAAAEGAQLIDGYGDTGRLIYGPAGALIVLGAAAASRQMLITVPGALRTLGAASYSIYLFQFVFIGLLWKLWLATGLDERMPHEASFPLLALAGVAGGIAMSQMVEYPLMRLVRGSRSPTPAAAAR